MSIPIITRTNTVDEWRIQTNLSAANLNDLKSGSYNKVGGSLTLSGNTVLSITSTGTSLQVSNNSLFQGNVTIERDVSVGVRASQTGNVTIGNRLVVLGQGSALQVANNALVNTDLQVVRTIYTGNVRANGNLTVNQNATVNGIVRIQNSGQTFYINTGSAFINTVSILDSTTVNAQISNAIINSAIVDYSQLNTVSANTTNVNILRVNTSVNIGTTLNIVGNTTSGNIQTSNTTRTGSLVITNSGNVGGSFFVTSNVHGGNLVTAGHTNTNTLRTTGIANVGTSLQVTSNTFSGNFVTTGHTNTGTLRTTGVANVGSGLFVSGNTNTNNLVNTGHINTTTLRTTGDANVGSQLQVLGNTTSGNITVSNAVFTNTLVTSGRVDITGPMRVRGGVTMDDNLSVEGDMGVFGDFEIKGNLIYDTDILTISANVPVTTGYAYFGVNRGNTMSQLGTVNANAYIRWSGFDNIFEIRDVNNPNNATSYSKILTANLVSNALDSTSIETIASSRAANSLNTAIVVANTSMRQYVDANVAILGQRVDGANLAIIAANTAMKQYVDANVAILGQRVNGANAAIVTANNAMKQYVDSTFFTRSGGTINGATTINGTTTISGNLSVSGTTTFVNSQQLQVGDNIITLNADVPTSQTPSENSGIEVNRGSSINVALIWNETSDRWTFTNNGTTYFNIPLPSEYSLYTATNGVLLTGTSFGLTGQASALHNLATNGLIVRTGAGTVASRSITASTGITVSNGDGVSGNPTITNNDRGSSQFIFKNISNNAGTTQFSAGNNNDAIRFNATGAATVSFDAPSKTVTYNSVNTTYSSGNGILLSGTTFSVGAGLGLTQEASGLALTAITSGDATIGSLRYNATTRVAGQMYGGTTTPINTTRLNYDGNLHATQFVGPLSGNADTSTTLQTARTINGTSFNGSGNIITASWGTARTINGSSINGSADVTTANWGTARTITVGNTGKSVNGSGNVAWSLAEIGAAATAQTMHVGTTALAINRASATQTLSGVSIDGNSGTVTNGVYTVGNQTVGGTKTFSSTIVGNISGTASNITSFTINQSVGTSNNVRFNSLGIGTDASGTAGQIRASGQITSFFSDIRLKENIYEIDNPIEKVMSLRGVNYTPNELAISYGFKNEPMIGVIAQEVEKVIPEAIKPAPFDIDENDNSLSGQNYKTVQYEKLVPLLIEAIKELKREIDDLKK
jgi:hypothetical protein